MLHYNLVHVMFTVVDSNEETIYLSGDGSAMNILENRTHLVIFVCILTSLFAECVHYSL